MSTNTAKRQIRVFLSSTFADMQDERNYLVKKVFPMIKAECHRRNVNFSVIDLRWGVTEEDSKSGKVIEICIDEIEHTRPFFIGMIGGRYGWIPGANGYGDNNRLLQKYPWIEKYLNSNMSITEIEMQYGALKSKTPVNAMFFIRQDNYIPEQKRETDKVKIEKLKRLKTCIAEADSKGLCSATSYTTPKDLGRRIYNQLMAKINDLYPDENLDFYSIADKLQRAKENELRQVYINGRIPALFTTAADFDTHRLVIGKNGMGKSAFVANYYADTTNEGGVEGIYLAEDEYGFGYVNDERTHEEGYTERFVPIIRTYIDNDINTVDKCYRMFLKKLGQTCPTFADIDLYDETPISLKDIFENAHYNERILWMLDGVDRLIGDDDLSMAWVNQLPNQISLVVTATDEKIKQACRSMQHYELCDLSSTDIIEITKRYLAIKAKHLVDNQYLHIARCNILRNPSLLIMFLNELQEFGIYERVDEYIDHYLSARDENDFYNLIIEGVEEEHGRDLTAQILCLLAVTQTGLAENLLASHLSLPPIEWASLYGALRLLTIDIDGHIMLADQSLQKAVIQRYIDDRAKKESFMRQAIKLLEKETNNLDRQSRQLTKRHNGFLGFILINLLFANTIEEHFQNSIRRNNTELVKLYAETQEWGKLYQRIRSITALSDLNIPPTELYGLYPELYKAGYHVISSQLSCWSLYRLILLSFFVSPENYRSQFMTLISAITLPSMLLPEDIRTREINRIVRNVNWVLLLPWGMKREIKNNLRNYAVGQHFNDDINIEDTWSPGRTIDYVQTPLLLNSIETILDTNRVEHILQQANMMLDHYEDGDMEKTLFQLIAAQCYIRLENRKEAEDMLDTVAYIDKYAFIITRIEILFDLTFNDLTNAQEIEDKIMSMRDGTIEQSTQQVDSERYMFILQVKLGKSPDVHQCMERMWNLLSSCTYANEIGTLQQLAEQLLIFREYYLAATAYLELNNYISPSSPELNAYFYSQAADCFDSDKEYYEAYKSYTNAADAYKAVHNNSKYHHCSYQAVRQLYLGAHYVDCINLCEQSLEAKTVNASHYAEDFYNIIGLCSYNMINKVSGDKSKAYYDKAFEAFLKSYELAALDDEAAKTIAFNLVNCLIEYPDYATASQLDTLEAYNEKIKDKDAESYYTNKCQLLTLKGNNQEAILTGTKAMQEGAFDETRLAQLKTKSTDKRVKKEGIEYLLDRFIHLVNNNYTKPVDTKLLEHYTRHYFQFITKEDFYTALPLIEDNDISLAGLLYMQCVDHYILSDPEPTETYDEVWVKYLSSVQAFDERQTTDYIKLHIKIRCIILNGRYNIDECVTQYLSEIRQILPDYPISKAIFRLCRYEEWTETIVRAVIEAITQSPHCEEELAKVIRKIDEVSHSSSADIFILFIEKTAKLIRQYSDTTVKDKRTVGQVIMQLIYNMDINDMKMLTHLYNLCGLPIVLPIRDEDYNDIDAVIGKYNQMKKSHLEYYVQREVAEKLRKELIYRGHYQEALSVCNDYGANEHHADFITSYITDAEYDKAQCLFQQAKYQEALNIYQYIHKIAEENDGENDLSDWDHTIRDEALCLIYCNKEQEAIKLINNPTTSYPSDDGLACIKIVEAIAYVHRHLMADAQSLFEQAAKEANIEDGKENNECQDDAVLQYCALYYIETALALIENNEHRLAKQAKAKALKFMSNCNSGICQNRMRLIDGI